MRGRLRGSAHLYYKKKNKKKIIKKKLTATAGRPASASAPGRRDLTMLSPRETTVPTTTPFRGDN